MSVKSIGTHSIALYVNGNNTIYFDSFVVDHIIKKIKRIHTKEKHQKKYL